MLQAILHEAHSTQRCVLNGLVEGHQTENEHSICSKFHSNSLATSFVCKAMYMNLNLTLTSYTPVFKETMILMMTMTTP
jgi:hypothetical protein